MHQSKLSRMTGAKCSNGVNFSNFNTQRTDLGTVHTDGEGVVLFARVGSWKALKKHWLWQLRKDEPFAGEITDGDM